MMSDSYKSIADRMLEETIIKIDGAYAEATIRAYRVDFQDFIIIQSPFGH